MVNIKTALQPQELAIPRSYSQSTSLLWLRTSVPEYAAFILGAPEKGGLCLEGTWHYRSTLVGASKLQLPQSVTAERESMQPILSPVLQQRLAGEVPQLPS